MLSKTHDLSALIFSMLAVGPPHEHRKASIAPDVTTIFKSRKPGDVGEWGIASNDSLLPFNYLY